MTTDRTDVVVVGAGAAGLSAATEAARRGAEVVVVDAAPVAGGTAATAGGGTCLAGSVRQAELGIRDDPETALEDWIRWGGPTVDVAWAERYLRASGRELYRFLAELGVRWGAVRLQEGNRVPRWHEPDGGGAAVAGALERAARGSDRVRWALATRLVGLETVAGAIRGVHVVGAHGPRTLRAGAVILATGGFASDPDLVREHAPVPPGTRVLLGGGAGARGEGHRLLRAVGADLVHLDAVWMYPYATPDPADPTGRRGLVVRGLDGDLWVDRTGTRFHDESRRGGATGTPALLGRPGGTCWSIFDAAIAARVTVAAPAYRRDGVPDRAAVARLLATSPHAHTADDPAVLAERAGIDPVGLARTIARHDRVRRLGHDRDADHGRVLRGLAPFDRPPLHALQLFPVARKNLGGVRTDEVTRVLDVAGRAIDGLLAAGEVAGMAGGHINGRAALEGTMLGPSIFSGRTAGAAAVA